MKKRPTVLFFISLLSIILIVPFFAETSKVEELNRTFLKQHKNIDRTFLKDECIVREYHPGKKTIYAVCPVKTTKSRKKQFISFHLPSGRKTILNKSLKLGGIPGGASAIDTRNERFFCIGYTNPDYTLFVLDNATGKILKKHRLKNFIKAIVYNEKSGNLSAVRRNKRGFGYWIEINVLTGAPRNMAKIRGLSRILSNSSFIDSDGKTLTFLAQINKQSAQVLIDLDTRKVRTKEIVELPVGGYLVHSFDKKKSNRPVATVGVQACTGIAGYSQDGKIGFMAHISPRNIKIPLLLKKIDRKLKKRNGSGLNQMKIEILGGLKYLPDSFRAVVEVYRELLVKYNVSYTHSNRNHIGKSYSIILENDNVIVF